MAIPQAADFLGDNAGGRRALAGGNRRTSLPSNCRECSCRFIARRSATSGCTEVRSGGSNERKLSRPERTPVYGNADTGYAPRAATLANGPGVHYHRDTDAGAWYWRDHLDFHFGACRPAEVAAGGEAGRTVPPGERSAVLLLGRVQPRK